MSNRILYLYPAPGRWRVATTWSKTVPVGQQGTVLQNRIYTGQSELWMRNWRAVPTL